MNNQHKSVTSKNFHEFTPAQRRFLIIQDREWRDTMLLVRSLRYIGESYNFYDKQASRLRCHGYARNFYKRCISDKLFRKK